jgi:predicted acyl esterase
MAERHVWIPMADGVRLAASLYLPDTRDPCGCASGLVRRFVARPELRLHGVRFAADATLPAL